MDRNIITFQPTNQRERIIERTENREINKGVVNNRMIPNIGRINVQEGAVAGGSNSVNWRALD